MTPVPSVASTHLRGLSPSASLPHPSPSTSPTRIIPVSSTNLWPVLFAPLAVVLLVLLIVAVTAIVYYKRRRRDLNLKIGLNKESSPEECRTERVYKGWFIPLLFNLSTAVLNSTLSRYYYSDV